MSSRKEPFRHSITYLEADLARKRGGHVDAVVGVEGRKPHVAEAVLKSGLVRRVDAVPNAKLVDVHRVVQLGMQKL